MISIFRDHPRNISLIHILFQIIIALRNQVQQGNMTQQQALDRLAMMQASTHSFREQSVPQQFPSGFNAGAMPSGTIQQQNAALSQRAQVSANNQINALQHVIQAQDPSRARQFDVLLPGQQQQRQQNATGIASYIGQNLNPSGMGLPQGPGSLQQNFIQPSPSVPQPPIQSNKLPGLSEDRFNSNFIQFARSKGIGLSERDLVIDDRRINLWALHRTVFSRNGFDQVRLVMFLP